MQNQISPLILSFGVSDPVGAAGIQADLAAYAAMGCHGLTVVTGILIGDTSGVEDMQPIDSDCVTDQARVVLEDMPVAAMKIGALCSIENIAAIAEIASDYPDIPLVLDPFLSGLPEQGFDNEDMLLAMRELLVPQSTLLVASAVELGRLGETWRTIPGPADLPLDAAQVIKSGCEYVLVTHSPGELQVVSNMLIDETGVVQRDTWQRLPASFIGAGSTLSAAITALLGNGLTLTEAVREAQEFTYSSLSQAQRLGMGKLVPDRYFWAREAPDESEPEPQ